jgi:uncharacterized protein with FMN-binding domain
MRKALFSFVFVSAFAAQALYQHLYGPVASATGLTPAPSGAISNTGVTNATLPTAAPPSPVITGGSDEGRGEGSSDSENEGGSVSAPAPVAIPAPAPAPTPAPKPVGQYADGTFVGTVADAYYGLIQVETIISGGKIVDVRFLQYPNDRSTSREINSQAMPYLKQEAITAQNASVNIISGATDSSIAFRESLASALAKAKV